MDKNTRRWLAGALGALLLAPLHAQENDPDEVAEDFDRSPEECVSAARLDTTQIVDDHTILFYMRGDDIYRNTLDDECPGLERAGRFSHEVRTGRICETDTITVLEQFGVGLSPGFTCRLGQFQPVSAAEAEEIEAGLGGSQGADAVEVEEVELSDRSKDGVPGDEAAAAPDGGAPDDEADE